MAVDQAGTIYVGNEATHKIVKVSQAGALSEFVGSSSVAAATDGVGEHAGFDTGIDQLLFDNRSKTLYAIDRRYGAMSGTGRSISQAGEVGTLQLSTFATHPSGGPYPASTGDRAAVIAFGADDALYAATVDDFGLPDALATCSGFTLLF